MMVLKALLALVFLSNTAWGIEAGIYSGQFESNSRKECLMEVSYEQKGDKEYLTLAFNEKKMKNTYAISTEYSENYFNSETSSYKFRLRVENQIGGGWLSEDYIDLMVYVDDAGLVNGYKILKTKKRFAKNAGTDTILSCII